MKKLILFISLMVLILSANAQSGSDCSSAISFSTPKPDGTDQTQKPLNQWYIFTSLNNQAIINLLNRVNPTSDKASKMTLWAGTCGGTLTQVASDTLTSPTDSVLSITTYGITTGTTYFLQITKLTSTDLISYLIGFHYKVMSPFCSDCTLPIPDACDLICNPSFEYYDPSIGLPTAVTPAGGALPICGWDNATFASPDYFNSGSPFPVNVPNTFEGMQSARTGGAMAGFIAMKPSGWHEYIYQQLRYPLTAGVTYTVSFWTIPSPNSTSFTDRIGAWLTDFSTLSTVSSTSGELIGATPQVVYAGFLSDQTMWTQVSQTFVATGTEELIVIGNYGSASSPPLVGGDFSYYFLEDVSVKPLIGITATATPPTICLGENSTLTANPILPSTLPSSIIDWAPTSSLSCVMGCLSTTATPVTTTTYTATATYHVGCTSTASATVTVVPPPPAPSLTTTGATIICSSGTSVTYTITTYNPANTYNATITGGLGLISPVSGGSFNVTWLTTSGNQITVVAITPEGCQSVFILDIQDCCVSPPGIQNFVDDNATNLIAFYGTGSIIVSQTFYINGTFTVDQDLTLEQCTVYLAPNAKINIINNSIFRIADNSILLAGCGAMWDGIYIPNNSHVLQVKTSIVQDGINAIVSDNGGIYDVTASVLNKNYKSIVVNAYSPHHFGSIGGTTVSCVASATSPGTLLLPPYNTERSAVGIEVNNVRNALALNIGAPALAGKNTFDNLDIGVYSNQSNVKIVHNDFKNIQIIPGQVATAAIYAVGKPFVFPFFTTYNLTVGGYGVFEPNTFLNCVTGVYTTTNMNVNVYKNDFNFITQYGVRCETSRIGNGINIKNNDIKNFTVGIRCRFNTFCNTQIEENKLKITSSFFFPSSIGIWLEEPSTASTVSDYKVFNNKIQVVKYGIRAFLLNGAILDNNKIELRPSGTTIGIEVIANYGTQITTNDVQSIPATYTTSVGGIYASMSPLSYIYCNTVKDMGYGIKCAGSMASDIFKNTMKNDFYGFWLDNNGFVGLQDRPGFPGEGSYNKWILPIPGARCYATNSTDGTSSPFVYRSGASSQLIPLPSITDFSPLVSAIIATGTTTGPPALALCPSVPPPTLLKRAQDLAMEMIAFPGNDANTKWLSKQGLFHNIKSDSIDVSGDAILQTFVNQAAIENVGKLSEINKTLVDVSKYNTTDMLIAQSLSSSIVPNNDIETNQKLIADIIVNNFLAGVDYSSSQLSDLRILASKCPFTDGIGVYQARVLLSPIDSIGTEYANSCETGENRSSIFNSESVEEENVALMVYPNPASDQLTINYQLTETDVAVFEIYNVVGEIVLTQTLNTSEGEQKLSLTNLNSGIYFYKYSINDRIVRKNKLVIVK